MNIKIPNTKIILFLILVGTFSQCKQTNKYPADIEDKISQVENNLACRVKTGDHDTWTRIQY